MINVRRRALLVLLAAHDFTRLPNTEESEPSVTDYSSGYDSLLRMEAVNRIRRERKIQFGCS